MVTFGEPLGHVITLCEQIWVSRTDDLTLSAVCPLKTCPCVRSKRLRVYRHRAQHSNWNSVGTNRPQHRHMYGHIVCDWTCSTHQKIDSFQKKNLQRRKSNSNLQVNSKDTRNRSIGFGPNWKLVQSEVRSKKRIAVLSNPIARNRSFQHTTCDLYWGSGIHEDWRGFVLQSTSISEVTAKNRTEEELCHKATNLHGCLVLYWSGICKVDNSINLMKKQENLHSTKPHRTGVTEKPAAATLNVENQAHLSLQSNKSTGIAKKRSNSWFSSSRITQTRSLSCRTWIIRWRLISSAKSRRSWSPTWAIPRSSSFAKPLPRNNA